MINSLWCKKKLNYLLKLRQWFLLCIEFLVIDEDINMLRNVWLAQKLIVNWRINKKIMWVKWKINWPKKGGKYQAKDSYTGHAWGNVWKYVEAMKTDKGYNYNHLMFSEEFAPSPQKCFSIYLEFLLMTQDITNLLIIFRYFKKKTPQNYVIPILYIKIILSRTYFFLPKITI